METFVLVHPAWFGGWCWKKLMAPLRAAGHEVCAPTLTGLGDRAHLAHPGVSLSTHIDDVVNFVNFEDLHAVTLVGNSSGGTVITGIADRLPRVVNRVVYLDAFVPSDGQSTRDLVAPDRRANMEQLVETEGEGWSLPRHSPAPWNPFLRDAWQLSDEDIAWVLPRLRPTPFGHFKEPLHLRHSEGQEPDRIYIRCLKNRPHPHFDAAANAAKSSPGWSYRELNTPHLPFITHPGDLTELLLDIVG